MAAVFRSRDLRLLNLGLAGSCVGHWAFVIAVSVYAYRVGGAGAVGVVWLVRMIPAAAVSPFSSVLADRLPRVRVLVASDLARAGLMTGAAIAVWSSAPAPLVYTLASLVSLAATPAEPAFAGLMPELATTPAELTAANVAASTIQSVGFFAGPAVGGLLLAVSGPGAVMAVTAALVVWSAAFTSRIRGAGREGRPEPAQPGAVRDELSAGFRAIGSDGRLAPLIGLLTATTLVDGALEVFIVVVALKLLALGNSGVGYLNAGFGAGALIGALACVALVGVRRLSVPFVIGVVLWGAPLALLATTSKPAVAFVLLAVVGFGNTLFDVAGTTLVQRIVPGDVISRVFGVMQSLWLAGIGVGAALAPVLISALGVQGALVATGLFLPALVVLIGRKLVRIDSEATAPGGTEIGLLQAIPLFAPLPGLALERIAFGMEPVEFAPGETIIREGDAGDRVYVIAEGRVDVTTGGLFVASLGPGDIFGEIALLREVPRTATVTAREPLRAFALERPVFLDAVAGNPDTALLADMTVGARLLGLQQVRRGRRLGV